MRTLKLSMVLVTAALVGCSNLPNVQPFADATTTLSTAVKASGDAVRESLAPLPVKKEQDPRLKEFDEAWAARTTATHAMASYAAGIAEVAKAGQSGREAAGKVADGLGALFGAASPAMKIVIDATKMIVGEIAKVRAAASLEEALLVAQPFVDQYAQAMQADSAQLTKLVEAAEGNRADAAKNASNGLSDRYRAYESRITKLRDLALGPNGDAARKEGMELASLYAEVIANYAQFTQAQETARKAHLARIKLLGQLGLATEAWRKAHKDLVGALQARRTVDVTQLKATLEEIQGLIKRIEAL